MKKKQDNKQSFCLYSMRYYQKLSHSSQNDNFKVSLISNSQFFFSLYQSNLTVICPI